MPALRAATHSGFENRQARRRRVWAAPAELAGTAGEPELVMARLARPLRFRLQPPARRFAGWTCKPWLR